MNPVQGIEEEQPPEPQHGQEVAVDWLARCGRYYKVEYGQCQRRDEEPYRVMDPQATEGGAGRTWYEFRDQVAHGVGHQGEHQCPDDVPARYVEVLKAMFEEGRQELDRGQQEGEDYQHIHRERKFGPLQWLAVSTKHQPPARNHDGEIPQCEEQQPDGA